MIENIRFALRQIIKNPGFASLAILTLALGIGANTAMFTVIDTVLLRPLPYRDADRLVAITPGLRSDNSVQATSWPNYRDIREQTREVRDVAAYMIDFVVMRTAQGSEGATAIKTTANLLDILGVQPIVGRSFVAADNEPGAAKVVILSAPFWRKHFNSDTHVAGQTVRIGDEPNSVIGVLPDNFRFSGNDASSGVWLPYQPTSDALSDRGSNFIYLLGSLRPGARIEAAQDELTSIANGIAQRTPKGARGLQLHAIPFRNVVTSDVRAVFLALTGALILVLLIACANVANLQLARCLGRTQEFAVRIALGASRRALMMQMLIEGGVLCAFGAAAGLALAQLMLSGIRHLPPDLIPRADEIHLRASVFVALLVAAAVVTLLSSIAPAVLAGSSDPQAVLQEGARGSSGGPKRSRVSATMVAGEVALSVILLISSGLMFRTLYKLEHKYLGFDQDNLTTFLALPGNAAGFFTVRQAQATNQAESILTRVYEPMRQKLRGLPGVLDVAFANAVPLQEIDMHSSFDVVGRPKEEQSPNKNSALIRTVSGGYARVLGTPAIRGRMITEDDSASSPYVIVINETFAKRYFAGQDPIGQQLELGGKDTGMITPYTIVGVMADAAQNKLAAMQQPEMNVPYAQIPVTSIFYQFMVAAETNYVVRTHASIEIVSVIRSAFRESAPDFALEDFKTLRDAHDQAAFNQRLGLYLIGSFATIAVIMVLAGLYGVLSHLVGQRRREIGIRMALGASRELILNMVLRRGLRLIGVGLGIGLLASLGAVQSLRSFLYEVSPLDAPTYFAVAVILLAVGTSAALIPARRAASIEPTQALRAE